MQKSDQVVLKLELSYTIFQRARDTLINKQKRLIIWLIQKTFSINWKIPAFKYMSMGQVYIKDYFVHRSIENSDLVDQHLCADQK